MANIFTDKVHATQNFSVIDAGRVIPDMAPFLFPYSLKIELVKRAPPNIRSIFRIIFCIKKSGSFWIILEPSLIVIIRSRMGNALKKIKLNTRIIPEKNNRYFKKFSDKFFRNNNRYRFKLKFWLMINWILGY